MKVIFVCTGNTCRSPMAEYYLKSKKIDGVLVTSRGFCANEAVNPNSVAVMNEVGIDISCHRSQRITAAEIEDADAIFCMTESHKQHLTAMGLNKNNIFVLGGGIDDPFGNDIHTYRNCRDNIFTSIDNLIKDSFFSKTIISRATDDDVADIAKIEKACFSAPWSENAIRESLIAGTRFYIVRADGNVVAYMGVSTIAGEGYVTNIAVLPYYRRQGIGQKLLNYVINDINDTVEFISLEVRVLNNAAISLYNKLGFLEVGRRKKFYTSPDEDALIMTKYFI